MSLSGVIKEQIENFRGAKVKRTISLSGGCINETYRINFEDDFSCLIKLNEHSYADMFIKEAHGLQELRKANAIRVPEVYLFDTKFILMEFINSEIKKRNFFEDFGRKFALLHRYTANGFGFYEDNYIGSTPQLNISDKNTRNSWTNFYFNNRLLYQYKLVERNCFTDSNFKGAFLKLSDKIDSILTTTDVIPSVLHGDLWSGNYISDDKGEACIIDPAVYYGDREADLAMTKLFGGFPASFYAAYNEAFPLGDGWEYRENIYKLYHVLNHLNLFGGGYYSQALMLMKYYL